MLKFLLTSLYIGARDQDIRTKKAAKKLQGLAAKSGDVSGEAAKLAQEYNVPASQIKQTYYKSTTYGIAEPKDYKGGSSYSNFIGEPGTAMIETLPSGEKVITYGGTPGHSFKGSVQSKTGEKRRQTFTQSGKKLTDTRRVKVDTPTGEKWVRPENVPNYTSNESKIREAEQKYYEAQKPYYSSQMAAHIGKENIRLEPYKSPQMQEYRKDTNVNVLSNREQPKEQLSEFELMASLPYGQASKPIKAGRERSEYENLREYPFGFENQKTPVSRAWREIEKRDPIALEAKQYKADPYSKFLAQFSEDPKVRRYGNVYTTIKKQREQEEKGSSTFLDVIWKKDTKSRQKYDEITKVPGAALSNLAKETERTFTSRPTDIMTYGASIALPIGKTGTFGKLTLGTARNIYLGTKTGEFLGGVGLKTGENLASEQEKRYILDYTNFQKAMQAGYGAESGSFRQFSGYKKSIESFYKEQGLSGKELKAATKRAVENPEQFYTNLGYTGTELQTKIKTAQSYQNEPWYKGYSQDIPFIPLFWGKEGEFKKGVTEYYKSQGLSGKELQTAVNAATRQRTAGLWGEGIGALGGNVASEVVGEGFVGAAFKNIGRTTAKGASKKAFKTAFVEITQAGAFESSLIQASTAKSRYQDIDYKKLVGRSYLEGAAAGVIGGGIVGLSLAKKPASRAAGKVIEYGAYITDPLEKPGDIIAGQAIKRLNIPILTPTIVNTAKKEDFIPVDFGGKRDVKNVPFLQSSIIQSQTQTQTKKTKTPTTTKTSSNIFTFAPVTTTTNVPAQINTNIKSNVDISPFVDTRTSIFTNVPVETNTPINTNIPVNAPVNTPINTNVPINTNTFTNIFTNVPVPVTVPRPLIPPPVPLAFDAGGGSGFGFGKGKKKKYVNELAAGAEVLSNLTRGYNLPKLTPSVTGKKPQTKKKSSKKKRKGNKKKSNKPQPFDPMQLIWG